MKAKSVLAALAAAGILSACNAAAGNGSPPESCEKALDLYMERYDGWDAELKNLL